MRADYAFYRDEFRGKLTPDEFERLAVRAEAYIGEITFGRTASAEDPALLRHVMLAQCAAVDAIQKNENGGGIASETAGKYTVSYVAGISAAGTDASRLYEAVRPFLAGTGLLYRGV